MAAHCRRPTQPPVCPGQFLNLLSLSAACEACEAPWPGTPLLCGPPRTSGPLSQAPGCAHSSTALSSITNGFVRTNIPAPITTSQSEGIAERPGRLLSDLLSPPRHSVHSQKMGLTKKALSGLASSRQFLYQDWGSGLRCDVSSCRGVTHCTHRAKSSVLYRPSSNQSVLWPRLNGKLLVL